MEKKRILFVHFHNLNNNSGGAKRTLQNYLGCSSFCLCDTYQTGKTGGMFDKFLDRFGHSRIYISFYDCRKIIRKIHSSGYDTVFFDTSLYGDAVKYIKKKCPDIRCIVHYHNFEKKYFEDESKVRGTMVLANRVARCEASASRYADFRVFISEEDRLAVVKQYGCTMNNSAVVPVGLIDRFSNTFFPGESYVVFLGSSFFANNQAVDFLISEIAPKVNKKIVVVGTGMKECFPKIYSNIEILGYISSLDEVLNGACAFVSPVFTGAGAKIKIADALMRGKYIIATKASLYGYDVENMRATICETAEDFISTINRIDGNKHFYSENRNLFLKNYSMDVSYKHYSFLI